MSIRHRTTWLAACATAMLSVGATAVVAHADPGPAALERMANAQIELYATSLTNANAASQFLPPSCDFPQPRKDVFLLPTNNGFSGTKSITCTVPAGVPVLVDLGGAFLYEDDNGPSFPLDGKMVEFSRKNLRAIGEAILDLGFNLPPTGVTLDGGPVTAQRVVTDPVRIRVPDDPAFEDDSATLKPEGKLWVSFAGYKALLPPLAPGTHEVKATLRFGDGAGGVGGVVPATWVINVR